MKIKELPPLATLQEMLCYNPETGELLWKVDRHSNKVKGKTAGSRNGDYYVVRILSKNYYAHRIAYALHYGEQLSIDTLIDHIDGDRSNNCIDNLRKANHTENAYNRKVRANSDSGHNGVSLVNYIDKWKAQIVINGRQTSLGYFDCKEDAITARLNAEREHNIFVR
jgi:hypothetical protein